MPSPFIRSLLAALLTAAANSQSLVPAGSINEAIARRPIVLLTHDDRAVVRFVEAIGKRFFADSPILIGKDAADADLRGKSAVVYATPEHAWWQRHGKALPFAFGEGEVTIEGRTLTGKHLRVIAALRNPVDAEQRVLLYSAARTRDLVDINSLFHGPTEWVVADGTQVLASGAFASAALPPEQMQADLDALVRMIGEVHPAAAGGLPDAVAAAARRAREAIAGPLDRARFAGLCAQVIVALHDAHSAVALPTSGEGLALPFVWLDDGLVVDADLGELRRGDRIAAIAGSDAASLMARLAERVPAENPHWLRLRAPGLLADLGVLRVLGVATAVPVDVRIERGGEPRTVAVGLGARPRAERKPWVRFEIDAERSLGVFSLDQCVVDETYKDTLDEFFAAVHAQKVTRIAVDLRRNSGGNSAVTDEFLRYVDVERYTSFGGDVRWSEHAIAQRKAGGRPRSESNPPRCVHNARRSEPPPFRGELFVLTGPATFSSGTWFATVVQDNGIGKIVGEPTGGAPSGFGDILTFTLPASGVTYTLSFKRWVRPDPKRDPAECLVPDVLVPRTAATVAAGTDPVLEWLRAR
jgi:C-terminal processing protease CtpA/Prc